jgi:cysteine desulfurase
MHANNEVGTVQSLEEISGIAHEHGILFHTDAVQSVGKIPVDVNALGVDLLSLSAHKFHGPKGVGALYVRKGTSLDPLIHGGHQEMDRRAGTENVAGIVGLGKAAEIASLTLRKKQGEIRNLRDYLWEGIQQNLDHVRLNGDLAKDLPNTLHAAFEYVEGESLVINLDLHGIAVSAGSACTSGAVEPSHVLVAMGIPSAVAKGSLRFSLGIGTTREEIDETVAILAEVVQRLRSMSPLYVDMKKGKV